MKRSATMVAALIASAGLALAGCGDKAKDASKKAPDKKGAAADGDKGAETAKKIKFKCKCGKEAMAVAASPPS